VVEQNLVWRQGSTCTGTSLPSSTDLPSEPPAPPSSSPPSHVVPSSLLLDGSVTFNPNVIITQGMTSYRSTNLELYPMM
jgi:hypothetical protein